MIIRRIIKSNEFIPAKLPEELAFVLANWILDSEKLVDKIGETREKNYSTDKMLTINWFLSGYYQLEVSSYIGINEYVITLNLFKDTEEILIHFQTRIPYYSFSELMQIYSEKVEEGNHLAFQYLMTGFANAEHIDERIDHELQIILESGNDQQVADAVYAVSEFPNYMDRHITRIRRIFEEQQDESLKDYLQYSLDTYYNQKEEVSDDEELNIEKSDEALEISSHHFTIQEAVELIRHEGIDTQKHDWQTCEIVSDKSYRIFFSVNPDRYMLFCESRYEIKLNDEGGSELLDLINKTNSTIETVAIMLHKETLIVRSGFHYHNTKINSRFLSEMIRKVKSMTDVIISIYSLVLSGSIDWSQANDMIKINGS